MNPKQLRRLMEQAQAMQEKMESALTSMRVEGVSGGGAVRVVLNGKKELQEVQLAREAVDPDDVEMLQDLILAAYQDGARQVDEQTQAQLQALGNLAGNLAGK
ncbi:MAG TPA: YbaB/EbfC family nucleoid-associated protein [Acidobacteriota bacterium]|nr:YbaB/EbfC family nucleoid-associated protein [Acidobacteriota bacterium]